MRITILNMQLLNFKGVRNLNLDFGNITNISGDNGTGKTTIFDAFTWLMFGKNSSDDKDFNIKTLDAENNPIHRLEHEVSATLEVDGRIFKLRRVFKEKWVKKRGEAESEFTGHETLFFADDVPLSQQEYKARVDFIMNESIAKMITSPTFFNSLKWQERRGVLEAMAGTISNTDIAGNNAEFKNLLSLIGNEKIADFKKKIGAKKALLKQSLDSIPTRIDEAQRSMPEELDYSTIETKIQVNKDQIAFIEAAMADKSKAYELQYQQIRAKQEELNQLKINLRNAEIKNESTKGDALQELRAKQRTIETDIRNANSELDSNANTIFSNRSKVERLTAENTKLRNQWNEENAKTLTIDVHELNCPACLQALPQDKQANIRENLTTNFNSAKAKKLAEITKAGEFNKDEIDKAKNTITELEKAGAGIETKVAELKQQLDRIQTEISVWEKATVPDSQEVTELKKAVAAFIVPESPVIDNTQLKADKDKLTSEISQYEKQLYSREQIKNIQVRIDELSAEEKKQAQELADLERMEFTLAEFNKSRVETIENRINGKFKVVKFKMFEQQINGGETECCECMVNGVPYSDVNTAGKIQAGIDIINALTEHYNINAPVFIDNRESIVRIPECKSQIINLIVKEGQKQLLVTVQDVLETAAQ